MRDGCRSAPQAVTDYAKYVLELWSANASCHRPRTPFVLALAAVTAFSSSAPANAASSDLRSPTALAVPSDAREEYVVAFTGAAQDASAAIHAADAR